MQIGLYDCQGPQPSIRYVHTSGEAKGPTTLLGLEEALPLSHLLAPVGACKDCIAAAVDSLEPEMLQHGSGEGSDSSLGTRSFGAALQAVLRWNCIHHMLRLLVTIHEHLCQQWKTIGSLPSTYQPIVVPTHCKGAEP